MNLLVSGLFPLVRCSGQIRDRYYSLSISVNCDCISELSIWQHLFGFCGLLQGFITRLLYACHTPGAAAKQVEMSITQPIRSTI